MDCRFSRGRVLLHRETRRMKLLLLLLLICALFHSGRLWPGTHSFVLVPSPQQNYPHYLSAHRNERKIYSSKTALFVRNIDGERRRPPASRSHNRSNGDQRRRPPASRNNNNRCSNNNPAIAINKKLVELGKKRQWKELLAVAEEDQASFDSVNYATVMSQLGRIRSFDRLDPRFLAFLQSLATMLEEQGLPWIESRQASNIIHAIGKMQLRNPSSKSILKWISTPATAAIFVEMGNAHDIANVAWACATLGFESPKLFAEIEHQSKWLVKGGKPQEVANTAWACAKLGFEAPKLFAEIDGHSNWLVKGGKPQEVANMAWACATLGFEAPKLFAEIDGQSNWLVEEGKPQEVANTAWACAKLNFAAPTLFAEIEHQSKWLVEEGNPQNVANTAWACATLGFEAPNLFAEIESQSKWLVQEGKPQEVANMAWACATLGYEAPKLFAEIEHQSKWLVERGNPQDVANTAWACATLGYEALEFFFELDQHADRLIEHGNPQEISNTCYAIAVLGMSKDLEPLLVKLWGRAIELFALDDNFIDENLRQLAQTLIFAEAESVKLRQIPERMANSMQLALSRSDKNVSHSSQNVSQLLNEIGFHHKCEVALDSSISSGMLAIDFACPKRMIAIEFDGPWHYLQAVGTGELTSTENGATKAKRRYLEQLGWSVINIDYRDYILAQRALNEKQWLWELLNASGVSLSNEQSQKSKTDGIAG